MRPDNWIWPIGILLLVVGCAPLETYSLETSPEYITKKITFLYKQGPAQTAAPDEIPARTLVKLLQKGGDGYSMVQLPEGPSGYVESSNIRPAPPTAHAVSEEKLFPERAYVEVALPEPDLSSPVEEIAPVTAEKPKTKKTP